MAPVAAGLHPSSESRSETFSGMAFSLIFWVCLLIATGLFGLVSLAPKFCDYLQLRSNFDTNQRKLVALEQQADKLGRVVHAIQNDPDFVAELTRIEFDAVGPDEEVIPVERDLQFDARQDQSPVLEPNDVLEWYKPYVTVLASNSNLRISLLGTAAVLVIVSFTMLPPAGEGQTGGSRHQHASLWQSLRDRYVRPS